MGASSWIYYVPYEEDLEQVLQRLRQQVFASETYLLELGKQMMVDTDGNEMDVSRLQEVVEQEDGSVVPVPPFIVFPQSIEEQIEETLRRTERQGTCSILDIRHVITDSRYYGALALPQEILHHFFADPRPDRAVVEAIVSDKEIWFWVEQCLQIEGPRFIYEISPETDRFFAREWSKQELIEALLREESVWINLRKTILSRIEYLARCTRWARAMPFSLEHLLRFFGSKKPTRTNAEEAFRQGNLWDMMKTWMGYYAILYQENLPHEIVFAGFSGD